MLGGVLYKSFKLGALPISAGTLPDNLEKVSIRIDWVCWNSSLGKEPENLTIFA